VDLSQVHMWVRLRNFMTWNFKMQAKEQLFIHSHDILQTGWQMARNVPSLRLDGR
jgi:hypothetical protein